MGAVYLIEFIKDPLLSLLCKARTGILHGKDQLAQLFRQLDPHLPTVRGEFNGVADQVVPHMAHHMLITQVFDAVQLRIDFNILGFPGRLKGHNGLPDLLIQAVSGSVCGDLLILQLGKQ